MSGEDGQRNGTPWPNAFGRLQTGPSERKPGRVEHVQQLEIRVDRLGAFDMQHRRQHVVGEAAFDIAGIAADANAALRFPLDPVAAATTMAKTVALRLRRIDRGRRRIVADDAAGFLRRRFAAGAVVAFRRRHEDREQAAGKSALARLGQIQMALVLALQEGRDRLRAGAPMQPQQHVVVAVEDGNGLGRGHLRSFVIKFPPNRKTLPNKLHLKTAPAPRRPE